MPVEIPRGIEPKHLAHVREIMEENLTNLHKSFDVMQMNLRLNKSGTTERLPYFIDWVGIEEVLDILKHDETELDPGLYRFGDHTPSLINEQAVAGALKQVINKDWKAAGLREKRPESKVLAQKAGVMYQKIIGILAMDEKKQRRCVGTLTAGFAGPPHDAGKIDEELAKLAGWTYPRASRLVDWIETNLVVGGPFK
jgi:hypothetical protein